MKRSTKKFKCFGEFLEEDYFRLGMDKEKGDLNQMRSDYNDVC